MTYLRRNHLVGKVLIVIFWAGLLVASGKAQTPRPASGTQAAPAGNADNGKNLFKRNGCYECHGYSAQGGVGARLAPNPIPFAALSAYVRAPKGQMPPYTTKVLSDAELRDIYAFLQSIPKPPDPKSIPLLNQ